MKNDLCARSAPRARRTGPVAWLLILPIRGYQLGISRFTPATCRYYPCCSSYAIGALRTHGAAKGLALAAWRLLRCNPWSGGGVDPVPPAGAWRPRREPVDGASAEHRVESAADDAATDGYIVIPDQPRSGETADAGRTAA